jgi:hypothetical protein
MWPKQDYCYLLSSDGIADSLLNDMEFPCKLAGIDESGIRSALEHYGKQTQMNIRSVEVSIEKLEIRFEYRWYWDSGEDDWIGQKYKLIKCKMF